MKKLALSLALFFALCMSMSAQSIHFICFADTNDPKIGKGVAKDVNLMLDFVMTLATGIGMEEQMQPSIVMMGDDCNSKNLKSIIQQFKCGPKDIVIFYYSGHGGRGYQDKSEFPQMCLGSNKQSEFVPLEYVKDVLVSKGARLNIILGDCCNSYSRYILPKENTLMPASEPTRLDINRTNNLKQLFLDTKGTIISSGSKKGEYSWVNSAEGGYFTVGFLRELDLYTSQSHAKYNWNELMSRTSARVVAYSKKALENNGGYVQTPIYNIQLRESERVPNSNIRIEDGIRTALVKIADPTRSAQQRINLYKSTLSTFFASGDSMIDIVGKDQQTLVNYTTASEYLIRLATVKGLANFTIIEQKKDANGKIEYLKLHEIYRE